MILKRREYSKKRLLPGRKDEAMKHEFWFDEDHDVVRVKLSGSFTMQELSEIISILNELLEDKKHRCILVDVSDSARILSSKEERKAMAEMAKGLDWEKVAVLGADPILRISSKIILAVMGKGKEAQFFKTDEETLHWLKGDG
ncbi:STAS/SEC14 domain-containing protein [candidate division WOR-3 bacterium]|nr:STAS/SEC14 domain-containing protein [candidate division WOR-3 bacterium]